MKRVTKVLIASGELLIAASLALMVTGLAMNDPTSTLGSLMSYETARRVHTIASYLFIPLFYVHTAAGLLVIANRTERLKTEKARRTLVGAWTVLTVLLVVAGFTAFGTGRLALGSVQATAVLTLEEVAKHSSENDCWVVVENRVYNVTSLIDTHPGGRDAILKYCGTNATEVFFLEHNQNDYEALQAYYIGTINGPIVNQGNGTEKG
ncbi:cytochrome b5 domain-containing protein [Thermococcus thioreducens]|uniref:Cytochrome b5 heme-binding domain-containing protein n=1 Tax=Thermococcus thioreducens TaxID=277988 RepID=A0A0Q2M297_9EURY|nr:cytochrome b5 domain-containing protein [Thermococcus thioreducens]ASJ12677.1 hypothetical protein A3L14_07165 [Thermococcus thioreducens]KQH82010.1 hypothetical protein AMR53_07940 [Thermococcus thioreducens]SEV86857.1 protein of unknown function [Thermococcus thioreducens]